MKFCPECGAKLLVPTCKFCPECGYKMPNISNDNNQPTAEPTPETIPTETTSTPATTSTPTVATPVATTANTPASNLSPEQRELAERFLAELINYDQAIGTYIKDSSNDNREAFYQAYKRAKEIADMLDYETKEPINMEWQTIEQSIDNLRMTSNKFMKFATFGGTCAGEKSLLTTIKNATSGAVSKLKRAFGLQGIIKQPAPVQEEQKVEETQPVQEKIVATSAEPSIQPQTTAPASKTTPQPVAPVQQPVQVQTTPQVIQPTTEKPKKKKKKVFIILGIVAVVIAFIFLATIILGVLLVSSCNTNDDYLGDYSDNTPSSVFYVDDDGKLYGIDYSNDLPANLVIPEEVDGVLVTKIDMWAFEYCSTVQTITIPDTVEVICPYAFGYLSLTDIIFEDTTTWYLAETSYDCTIHDGVAISVTDTQLNADNYEQYKNYYWYKI